MKEFENLPRNLQDCWTNGCPSSDFMKYTDIVFKLCVSEKEEYVYDTFVDLLKNNKGDSNYMVKAQTFHRIAAYIHRFWTKSNSKKDLYVVAEEINNGTFKTTDIDVVENENVSSSTAPPNGMYL